MKIIFVSILKFFNNIILQIQSNIFKKINQKIFDSLRFFKNNIKILKNKILYKVVKFIKTNYKIDFFVFYNKVQNTINV